MISLLTRKEPPLPEAVDPSFTGVRPVNFKRDLAPLADLIELAFSESMDSSGRAAIREMRMLSRMGAGLGMFSSVNDLISGISPGYVWIEAGRLVGNVSVYPAALPRSSPPTYIIANVATDPAFRGRGIARRLMQTALAAIQAEGARRWAVRRAAPATTRRVAAILQVEAGNHAARHLYDSLGFTADAAFTHWRRSAAARLPQPLDNPPYITRRRRGEWRAEYALAQRTRPALTPDRPGVVGWLRPLSVDLFRPDWSRWLDDLINLRSREDLVIRGDDGELAAALWIESAVAADSVTLTLFTDAPYVGLYDAALLHSAVRRFGARAAITIDHPAADEVGGALLRRLSFSPLRTLVQMTWDVPV